MKNAGKIEIRMSFYGFNCLVYTPKTQQKCTKIPQCIGARLKKIAKTHVEHFIQPEIGSFIDLGALFLLTAWEINTFTSISGAKKVAVKYSQARVLLSAGSHIHSNFNVALILSPSVKPLEANNLKKIRGGIQY